jgi:undecaprenol kinase
MSSGLQDRKRGGGVRSFSYAVQGILHAIKKERNLQIHTVIAVAVILFGALYQITTVEWICILLAIGGMFCLELMNTAIERTIDLITDEYHPLAKQAKDVAAGAVLVFACISVIIGCVIFLPKIF